MAENFLTEVEHSKLAGSYRDPDAGRVSLRKYAEEWVKTYSEDSSRGEQIRRQMRLHILPGLGSYLLSQLAHRPSTVDSSSPACRCRRPGPARSPSRCR